MKYSHLAILIASVLLLSAESPSPRPTKQQNETAALGQSQSEHSPSPVDNSYTGNRPPPDDDKGTNQEDSGNEIPTIIIAFFSIISGVATIYIAKFNKQLVSVTHDLKQATIDSAKASKDSAEAARDSADAAKLALQTNRPFVMLDSLELKSGLPGSEIVVTFRLRNLGKGPALVRELRAKLGILEWPDDLPSGANKTPEVPTKLDYENANLVIAEEVLGMDALSSVYRVVLRPIGDHAVARLKSDDTVNLAIQGSIRYQDVAQEVYETKFGSTYTSIPGYLNSDHFVPIGYTDSGPKKK
ncbi:MAG: hypothetical protein ACLQBA_17315 [Candidatus Binataceae bacterium]